MEHDWALVETSLEVHALCHSCLRSKIKISGGRRRWEILIFVEENDRFLLFI
jgi:hypothetical protein